MTLPCDSLRKAIVVAAHPDDEILWFSSIIDSIDGIILCYLDVDSNPLWSEGRRNALRSYPLPNTTCLAITESEVIYDGADWTSSGITEYGLKITKNTNRASRYKNNYATLRSLLEDRLKGYENVYTHNPWGEYGHEEHVQVYRAVKSLQKALSFRLWYPNYFSNKSAFLMNRYLARSPFTSYHRKTDIFLAARIKALYQDNHCWTWYNDYIWPDRECFILDEDIQEQNPPFGNILDLNFIRIWMPSRSRNTKFVSLIRFLRSLARKSR